MTTNMKKRTEHDLLGEITVSDDALYGAQTQRAVENFPVGNRRTIGQFPTLMQGLIYVKKAAAAANLKIGLLDESIGHAVMDACDKVLEEGMYDQFPIHYLHGGGGTSANMNANEVLANIGEELLGGRRGEYLIIHPNDHVNLNQSTNDVYPTACHIAVLLNWPVLKTALDQLECTFRKRAQELCEQVRIARTCLQDAVDVTFGDLLGGYAGFIKRACGRLQAAVDNLHSVNLGGTIVGRRSDVPDKYLNQIVSALVEVTGNPEYRQVENLFDAAQNPDELAVVSSQLDTLARGLIKIAQDFRLMGSGPETGLNEIVLPAMQAGSSIMPGKVNPVIPEFLIQVCFQVMGCNTACQAAMDHGELDLNVWESTMVFNILDAIELLAAAVRMFEEKCVLIFDVRQENNTENADSIMPLLTRLMHEHGYSKISEICKESVGDIASLRKLLHQKGFIHS